MAWRNFIYRTANHLREESVKILKASPLGETSENYLPMATLRSKEDLSLFITGCDADIGGKSTVHLELDRQGRGRFHGVLNGLVAPGMKLGSTPVDRSGYAGMRTKTKSTLFGTQCWDTSLYTFLKLRLRSPPPSAASTLRYFVNIQTDGPVQTDLFQHRLWLGSPGEWEDVLIPFTDFTLTNSGEIAEKQLPMMREKVRTVGISVMLPLSTPIGELDLLSSDGSDSKGGLAYDLGIESIGCTNLREEVPRGTIPAAPRL